MRVRKRYWLVAATLALSAFCADPASGQNRAAPRATQLWPGRAQRLQSMLIQGVKFSANWSLEQAEKIKDFFLEKFGHALPVSAMGQTAVHDRMKYDHHDAMDVALHPDSKEGRALIAYLRQTGTPFIAFRRKIAGLATGPHIHIGNRSPKLEVVPVVQSDSTQPSEAVGAEILQNH
jgi:hypothetical protein